MFICIGIVAFLSLVVWLAMRGQTNDYDEGEIAEDMMIGGTTMGRAVSADMIDEEIIAESEDNETLVTDAEIIAADSEVVAKDSEE